MKIKIITTTSDSIRVGKKIVNSLIKKKLSPCVQIIPQIKSTYTWEGKLRNSNEILIIIKTIPENVQLCKKLLLKLHNYDTTEIVVSEGEILNEKYKAWFLENSS